MNNRSLYQHDPYLTIGLTSRGTWTVYATKYKLRSPKWEDRFEPYYENRERQELQRLRLHGLLESEVPEAVVEAIEWLKENNV